MIVLNQFLPASTSSEPVHNRLPAPLSTSSTTTSESPKCNQAPVRMLITMECPKFDDTKSSAVIRQAAQNSAVGTRLKRHNLIR